MTETPQTPKEKSLKVPKDLGLVVLTKEQAFWDRAKKEIELNLKEHKDIIKFQEATLEMVESKIKSLK